MENKPTNVPSTPPSPPQRTPPSPLARQQTATAQKARCLNSYARQIFYSQNIPVYSEEWLSGGLSSFPSQGGLQQPDFGWNQDHSLNNNSIKNIIANAYARPLFYTSEAKRMSTPLSSSGRPMGYSPQEKEFYADGRLRYEDHEDGAGKFIYDGSSYYVSGLDLENVSAEMAFSLACRPDQFKISAGSHPVFGIPYYVDAALLAQTYISYLASSVAGIVRTKRAGNILLNDCEIARSLRIFSQASSLGVLSNADTEYAIEFLRNYVIQQYEKSYRGVSYHDSPRPDMTPALEIGDIYSIIPHICLVIPVLYDIGSSIFAVYPDLTYRLHVVTEKLCKVLINSIDTDLRIPYAVSGTSMKPHYSPNNADLYSAMAFRALVLGFTAYNKDTEHIFKSIYERLSSTYPQWMVDNNGDYYKES